MLLSFHFEPFWLLLSKVEIKHDFFLKLRSPTGKIYTIQFKACIFLLSWTFNQWINRLENYSSLKFCQRVLPKSLCIKNQESTEQCNASEMSSSSTTLHHLSKICKFKIIDSGGIRTHAISDWCLKPAP